MIPPSRLPRRTDSALLITCSRIPEQKMAEWMDFPPDKNVAIKRSTEEDCDQRERRRACRPTISANLCLQAHFVLARRKKVCKEWKRAPGGGGEFKESIRLTEILNNTDGYAWREQQDGFQLISSCSFPSLIQ